MRPNLRPKINTKARRKRVVSWLRAHGWKVGLAIIAAIIVVQLAYPTDRSLPFARVGVKAAGFEKRSEVERYMKKQFSSLQPMVTVDGQIVTRLTLAHLGATLDVSSSSERAFAYPWWQRLVPFSILALRPEANRLDVQFDTPRLEQALAQKQAVLQSEPRNATVSIKNGTASIVDQKAGVAVDRTSLQRSIETAQYTADRAVVLEPKGSTTPAARGKDNPSVQAAYQQAKNALKTPLTLSFGANETTTIEPSAFGEWLKAVEQDNGNLKLTYDEGRIGAYLEETYAKKLTSPAGVTKITTLDGQETARVPGVSGSAIDVLATAASIGEGVLGGGAHKATIQMQPVPPREEYTRNYTSTPRGVTAYVRDMGASGDITIALVAPSVTAEAKASEMVTAASTYKLFVAVMVLHKIDKGDMKQDDAIAGSTVGSCIDKMIVQSDNPCAEAFIHALGRREINDFFHSRGYSQGTTFTHAQSSKTTAADLVKLLQDIERAKDIKPEARDRLLALMKRQQFRQGIPAGSGASVADKVGFLGGVLNDAATVYHPRGTYHIAIMTDGQSWQKIAEITKKIEALLYP